MPIYTQDPMTAPENLTKVENLDYRIRRGSTYPESPMAYNHAWTDVFTGKPFQAQELDESNTIYLLTTVNNIYSITVNPDYLRKLREWLKYPYAQMVISAVNFSPIEHGSLEFMILHRCYNLWRIWADRNNVITLEEWSQYLKMSLTEDWDNLSTGYIRSGSLDMQYCIDFLTWMWDVKPHSPEIEYGIAIAGENDLTQRMRLHVYLQNNWNPDKLTLGTWHTDLVKDYHYTLPVRLVEQGVLRFDTLRQAQDALTSAMSDFQEFYGNRVRHDTQVGNRVWWTARNRFVFSSEEF